MDDDPRGSASRPLAAALATLAVGGCVPGQESSPGAPGAPVDRVAVEMRRLERSLEGCPDDAGSCTDVLLVYPDILSAPGGEAARRAIRARVADAGFRSPRQDAPVMAPEALARSFLDDYSRYRAQSPDDALGWSLERTIRVTLNTPEVFSVSVEEYSFTGGAHPNSFVTLLSLDPRSGRRLRLNDLLRGDFEEPLRELAEARFREARGLPPNADLRSEGLWFEDGVFRPNDNFAVEPEGLRFYFNSYEIAPYAFGPTDVLIARKALAGLARPGGPLSDPDGSVSQEG